MNEFPIVERRTSELTAVTVDHEGSSPSGYDSSGLEETAERAVVSIGGQYAVLAASLFDRRNAVQSVLQH